MPDRSEDPAVEQSPQGNQEDTGARALSLRLRQQEILAELGVVSLQRTPFRELLDRTVQFAAEGLEAELCKILEYVPENNRMLMRAGVGWNPGLIDVASVGADLEFPLATLFAPANRSSLTTLRTKNGFERLTFSRCMACGEPST